MNDDKDSEFTKIINEVKKEFPDNPNLQQLHIARRFISVVAKDKGLTDKEFIEKYFKRK